MKEKFRQPEQAIRLFFWLFAAACLLAAIAMPDRGQMVEGMLRLCTLPYQSANSYFDAANGRLCRYIFECGNRLRCLRGDLLASRQQAGRRFGACLFPDGGLLLLGHYGAEYLVLLCRCADRLPYP